MEGMLALALNAASAAPYHGDYRLDDAAVDGVLNAVDEALRHTAAGAADTDAEASLDAPERHHAS